MNVRTEIRDVRLPYRSLAEIFNYIASIEGSDRPKITHAEYITSSSPKDPYFLVNIEIAHREEMSDDVINGLLKIINEHGKNILQEPVGELNLDWRSAKALSKADVKTVDEILHLGKRGLLEIEGIGRCCIYNIEQELLRHGLRLRE